MLLVRVRRSATTCMIGKIPVLRKYASSTAARVGEQARDARSPARNGAGGRAEGTRRAPPSWSICDSERLATSEVDAARQVELHLLAPSGVVHAGLMPADRGEVDPIFVREQSAGIDRGRLSPLGQADALARKVARMGDSRVGAHVDRRMAKRARHEYGQRHERGSSCEARETILAKDIPRCRTPG